MKRKIILWGLAYAVSLYLGALYFIYLNQRAMQYTPRGNIVALKDAGIKRARLVAISDGLLSVRGWYVPPEQGKPIIVYYKGFAGSFTSQYKRFRQMSADGYGLIAFDYRGFPMSPGKINQENILADSLAVFDWAAQKGAPMVIWGRSEGAGPATYVASLRDAKALVLETPFTSATDMLAERYPFIPMARLLKDPFPASKWITAVREPVFVAHGSADKVIGVHHGKELYQLAPKGQDLWIVQGGGHTSLWADGLWGRVKAFLGKAG